ncbi:hypothetical protein LQV05_005484 [Cryptococcus neoformans]|nr:hypothetical protein C356_04269 [Cryptococcus neoformans var. grubii c45]OXB36048.1 hypothetical protein J007_04194 [Cryptococcus neoformans var. grubii]OXC60208.1 hypothetical protein C358_04309 [Cryptococcus neoformans var. grubii MW-RSA852]UOH82774.1 hypothetical protein LQV05_005484 [Cryptococcus neoformans]
MDPETQLKQNPGYDPKHDSAGAKHPNLGQGHAGANPQTGEAFEYAPQGAHSRLDRKDERNHGDALADAKRVEELEKHAEAEHERALKKPTAVAEAHGNEPSRGAQKDEELVEDDEEELRKKQQAKQQSKEAHKPKHP